MVKKSKIFDSEIYQKTSVSDLILFAVSSVLEKKEVCTFGRLIRECFNFFPKSFNFSDNQQWPDSRKIDRPLRTLRSRKLISGDPQRFFFLTKIGKKRAEQVAESFRQKRLIL